MSSSFISTDKPVVLLLHGFLGSKNQWDSVSNLIKDQFDLLTIELPGHGFSPSTSNYTIPELAIQIKQILKQYGIEKVHFVGHSMGGYVGAAFAKAYPQQLLSLTLVNSITGADSLARKQMRNRAIGLIDRFQNAYVSMAIQNLFTVNERKVHEELVQAMVQQAQCMTVESVLAALRAMRDRPAQIIPQEVPVQYIYGANDTVIEKKIIQNELGDQQHKGHELDGGHMLLLTHPKELVRFMHFIE